MLVIISNFSIVLSCVSSVLVCPQHGEEPKAAGIPPKGFAQPCASPHPWLQGCKEGAPRLQLVQFPQDICLSFLSLAATYCLTYCIIRVQHCCVLTALGAFHRVLQLETACTSMSGFHLPSSLCLTVSPPPKQTVFSEKLIKQWSSMTQFYTALGRRQPCTY